MLIALEHLTNRKSDPTSDEEPLFWRLNLEAYIYGEVDLSEAAKILRIIPEKVDEVATSHRLTMAKTEGGLLCSAGLGIARFDLVD
ncbi:hypothetical protein [Rhizobium mongolense]|uniref:Uncharacterized protein n=1 Tax=Rhizobium mongolense TaxID=57676 RepID=A0ABR6IXC4_9HYPH|nr:hypothetical protein [Rhizobium mongolense]MBB4232188.1 hypothetical protein [Rhizobium mongolense]